MQIPCGQWFLSVLFTAASLVPRTVPGTEDLNKNLPSTWMSQDFNCQCLFDWTNCALLLFLPQWREQGLSCTGRIQVSRVDKSRAVKHGETNKDVRGQRVSQAGTDSPGGDLYYGSAGVSIWNRDRTEMVEGLVLGWRHEHLWDIGRGLQKEDRTLQWRDFENIDDNRMPWKREKLESEKPIRRVTQG